MEQAMQVLTSRATDEWYTPPEYIERARYVLGGIDLDPATSEVAQGWIKASRYHTLDLSGFQEDPGWTPAQRRLALKRYSMAQMKVQPPWEGRVWLNSPFDNTPAWTGRLLHSYRPGGVVSAVQLCNSNLGYNWFEALWRTRPVIMAMERIRFIRADGTPGGQSKQGQAFVYYGRDVDRFREGFGDLGRFIPAGT